MSAVRSTAQEAFTREAVTERLKQLLGELLEMDPSDLDDEVPLGAFGIDSMTSAVLVSGVEKWCGAQLESVGALGSLTLTEVADEVVALLRPLPERN
ncbi:acyl carrier protein [Streptomyces erythrochromogenes]|uniref:acyl carrier protein n=1 Tax=Streptomyces erythrochromogenes TaxID=285574 RepID=UPI0036B13838